MAGVSHVAFLKLALGLIGLNWRLCVMPKILSSRLHMLTIDDQSKLEIYKSGSSVFVNMLHRSKLGTWRLVSMAKYHGDLITISRSLDGPVVVSQDLFAEGTAHVTRVPL